MTSLADRLRWVIESGKVESARAWCLKAGIAGSYLGTYLSRSRSGQPSDMGVSVLKKLGDAAKVSFAWLALGAGVPDDDLVPSLPANLQALIAKRPKAFPDALLRQAVIGLELTGEKDFGEDQWEDYLDGLKREARRLGLETAASRLDRRGVTR